MAGIVAGSVAGWSPIDRAHGENDSIQFSRSRPDLEAQDGIDIHPDTKSQDPVLVDQQTYDTAPSQSEDTTPAFNIGPFAGDPKMDDKPAASGS
jgi:Ca2+-transporting ATPase